MYVLYKSIYVVSISFSTPGLGRISDSAWLSGQISDIIWQEKAGYRQGMPNNPAEYLASGKKNQIWSNPS